MNIENLEQISEELNNHKNHIKIVNNYKEMCTLLDEPYKNSAPNRQKQLKEWKRYLEWKQDGHKYIITNVYSNPLPIAEEKIKNKLLDYNLCLLLLKNSCKDILNNPDLSNKEINEEINKHLQREQGTTYTITINNLALSLGLINDYYLMFFESPNRLSDYLDIDVNNIEEFYNKVSSYYTSDIKNTLKRLERNKVLIYTEVYRGEFLIEKDNLQLEYVEDEYNDLKRKVTLETETEFRDLTKEECEMYVKIQSDLLAENHCTDIHDYIASNRGNLKPFFREQNKRLYEEMKCLHAYKAYRIHFLPSFIFRRQKSLEGELTKLFANRITENKFKDITRKISKLCEDLEYQKNLEDLTYFLVDENNMNLALSLKQRSHNDIDRLKQSYEDFKILTRELINDYKRSKLKKIEPNTSTTNAGNISHIDTNTETNT